MNLFLLLFTIYTINLFVEAHRRITKFHPTSDTLLLTRCHLKCTNKSSSVPCNVSECIENISKITKFGKCSEKPKNCNQLDYCSKKDYNCPGTQKCCTYTCGDFCQDPLELNLIEGLPTIPINFTVTQKCVRIINVSWDMINLTTPILYVVETRAHIGAVFSEYKLSDWRYVEVQHEYDKQFKDVNQTVIRPVGSIRLRPGRWYEFRIAAVNENGTRGYSNHTKAFQLKEKPKPPRPPKKLLYGSLHQSPNLTVDTTIYWNVPRSDLPIEKYKLNWSLYLEGRTPSLLMEHAFVSEPFFHLKNLLPNSLYYIQVQSISSFGRKRLKSEKFNELLNTTISDKKNHLDKNLMNRTRHDNLGINSHRIYKRLPGRKLTLNFLPDNFNGITVKISWRDNIGESFIDLCPGDDSCFNRRLTSEFSSARIKKNYFQFSNLKYNRQYTIRLRHYNKKILTSSTFMTPNCANLQRKYPNTLLKC